MDAPKLLSIVIPDKHSLRLVYMPFLLGGGIFVPEAEGYNLGQEVFILLGLLDAVDRIPVLARVAWITPSSTLNNKPKGTGFGFQGSDTLARTRIENVLSGEVAQTVPLLTM